MPIADWKDNTVTISWTTTQEWTLEDDFETMAKKLGIKQKDLAKLLDDGETPDVDDIKSWDRLMSVGDMTEETFEINDLTS